MKEEKIRLLIEGAYAQTPTLPGYWLKYDDFRECFNDLVKSQWDEIVDIDTELPRLYPSVAFEDNYQIIGTEEVFRAMRLAPNKLVETKEFRKIIELKYKSAAKDKDGWTNFAVFGLDGLKEKCLEMGFVGVRQAVQCIFGKRFEFRAGDTTKHEAPVLVRDLKKMNREQEYDDQRNDVTNYRPGIIPPECEPSPKQGSYIGDAINSYAYFPKPKDVSLFGWDYAINNLATNVALSERWYYNEKDKVTKPILKKYISYTFERLCHEDEEERKCASTEGRKPRMKIVENEKYSVWNTGLVNNFYEPVYAFFSKNDGRNPLIRQPWVFRAFDTANSYQQSILAQFSDNNKPERAEYYKDPSELFYDLRAGVPTYNRDHILIDNINRLPLGFIKKDATDGFQFNDSPEDLPYYEKMEYYEKLRSAIKNDIDWFSSLDDRFKNAIKQSLKRVAWNYKTAIPTYYIEDREISILLPLALENKTKIDLALVCKHNYRPEKEINNYEGKTIFTLEMAYNNARLITRPDSDWLLSDEMRRNDVIQNV